MYINVVYKDAPELSTTRRSSNDKDLSVEKTLLVNPACPARVLLEYVRGACRLGSFAAFDLCDDSGGLMGLFDVPAYQYVADGFVHKHTYYIIVLKQESDKSTSVLPQLNRENKFYEGLKTRVRHFLATGEVGAAAATQTATPPPAPKSNTRKK